MIKGKSEAWEGGEGVCQDSGPVEREIRKKKETNTSKMKGKSKGEVWKFRGKNEKKKTKKKAFML